MDVEIKDMKEMRVAAVPHVGPYNQIGRGFERLGSIAGPAGLFGEPGAAMIAIFYDDPQTVPQDQLRSDAAIVVGEQTKLPDGLVEHRVPAGRYARALHVGAYEQLGDAWARLKGEWIPASGQRIGRRPSYEIYLNTPMQVPKEELRTELYVPLE